MQRGISGTHRMNGIFMAYGAAIRPGAVSEEASLYDLAPTIMHLMGEPVPEHMDGRVLSEVIVDGDRAVARQQWKESHGSGDGCRRCGSERSRTARCWPSDCAVWGT